MSHPATSMEGFQNRYCATHALDRGAFVVDVLGKCVHQPWRWLWPVVQEQALTWFYRDYELVLAVSRLRNLKEFEAEIQEFRQLHQNQRGMRGRLQRRISTNRLRALFLQTIGQETTPFSHMSGESNAFVLDHVTCP